MSGRKQQCHPKEQQGQHSPVESKHGQMPFIGKPAAKDSRVLRQQQKPPHQPSEEHEDYDDMEYKEEQHQVGQGKYMRSNQSKDSTAFKQKQKPPQQPSEEHEHYDEKKYMEEQHQVGQGKYMKGNPSKDSRAFKQKQKPPHQPSEEHEDYDDMEYMEEQHQVGQGKYMRSNPSKDSTAFKQKQKPPQQPSEEHEHYDEKEYMEEQHQVGQGKYMKGNPSKDSRAFKQKHKPPHQPSEEHEDYDEMEYIEEWHQVGQGKYMRSNPSKDSTAFKQKQKPPQQPSEEHEDYDEKEYIEERHQVGQGKYMRSNPSKDSAVLYPTQKPPELKHDNLEIIEDQQDSTQKQLPILSENEYKKLAKMKAGKEQIKKAEEEKQVEIDWQLNIYIPTKILNIVLVGESGSGKSSTGNLILAEKKFKVSSGSKICTTERKSFDFSMNGVIFRVHDTPHDWFGRNITDLLKFGAAFDEEVMYILVQNMGQSRTAKEAKEQFLRIKELLSSTEMHQWILLYTHGRSLFDMEDVEEKTLDGYLRCMLSIDEDQTYKKNELNKIYEAFYGRVVAIENVGTTPYEEHKMRNRLLLYLMSAVCPKRNK